MGVALATEDCESFITLKNIQKWLNVLELDISVESLIKQLNEKARATYEEYEKEHHYYKELVDEFNSKYVGRPVSPASKAHGEKIDNQLGLAKEKEGQYSQLSELIKEQNQELENLAADMRGQAH